MKRGTTLLEMNAAVLLAMLVLAGLFSFTVYFWRNHHHGMARWQFEKQCELFFDWLNQSLNQACDWQKQGRQYEIRLLDGSSRVVKLTPSGPQFGELIFFEQPVEMSFSLRELDGRWKLSVTVNQQDLRRSMQRTYYKSPCLQMEGAL